MLVLLLFVGVKNHIYKEQQLINIFLNRLHLLLRYLFI